jgi:hypothetical protein
MDLTPDELEERLTAEFLSSCKNLEDSVRFSIAISCLSAASDPDAMIDKIESSEQNLFLICFFLAGRQEDQMTQSVAEIIRNYNGDNKSFKSYRRKLVNLIQGDSLIDLGVDSHQFITDPSYRQGSNFVFINVKLKFIIGGLWVQRMHEWKTIVYIFSRIFLTLIYT